MKGLLCCEQEAFILQQDHTRNSSLAAGMYAVFLWMQIIDGVKERGPRGSRDDNRPWHGHDGP